MMKDKEVKAAVLLFIAPIPGAAIVGTYLLYTYLKRKWKKQKEEDTLDKK